MARKKKRVEPYAPKDFDPTESKWPKLKLVGGRGYKPWVRSILDMDRTLRTKDVHAIAVRQGFDGPPDRTSSATALWRKKRGYTSIPTRKLVNNTPGGLPANWLPPELEELRSVLEDEAKLDGKIPNLSTATKMSVWAYEVVCLHPEWNVEDLYKEVDRQGGSRSKSLKTTWNNQVARWRKEQGLGPLPPVGGISLPANWQPPFGPTAVDPDSWPVASLWVKHVLKNRLDTPWSWFEDILNSKNYDSDNNRRSAARAFDISNKVRVDGVVKKPAEERPNTDIGKYFEMLYEGWPSGKNSESVPMTATQIFGLLKSQKNPLLGLLPKIDGTGRAYPVALLMLSSVPKLHPRTWGYKVEIGRSDKGVKVYTLVKEGEVVKPTKITLSGVEAPTSGRFSLGSAEKKSVEVTGPWAKPKPCSTSEAIKKLEHVHELLGPICKAMGWRGLEYDVATGKVSAFKEPVVKPQLPDWLEVDE